MFQKNKKSDKTKLPAERKPISANRKNGLFSAGMIALVVAIVIIFNIAMGQLPTAYTQLDISNTQIYSMTDTTKEYMAELDTDVELLVLASESDTDTRISTFLRKFAALSDHVTVSYQDPTEYPSLLTEYDCDADSIMVICDETGNQTNVSFDDILVLDWYYYYYYGTTSYSEFDGEGQLVSAIDQVVSDTSYTIYLTTNHGESDLGSELTDLLTKSHFATAEVSLLMEEFPEDCDVLIINQPTSDITTEELETIRSYLAEGGQVELILASTDFDHPNLDALMADYGLEMVDGYIGDESRYMAAAQSYFVFFPELDTSSDAADGLSSDSLVLLYGGYNGYSLGMTTTDLEDDTIDLDTFLTTSEYGIAVVDESNYTEGEFVLAATATQTITVETEDDEENAESSDTEAEEDAEASDTEAEEDADDDDSASSSDLEAEEDAEEEDEEITSRFTVYSCPILLDDDVNSSYGDSIVNLQVFMNNLTAGFEEVSTISIASKSLEVTYNTSSNAGLWSLLYVAVLPLIFVVLGFFRWMKRRKL
ncbi:MAG: GldG family protein [Clostridiales bacterium]|nr:GldG family protein [Clostridiales bacterium]